MLLMKRLALAFLVYVFVGLAGYGQNGSGITTIVGRVSYALRLSLRDGWMPASESLATGLRLAISADQPESLLVRISGPGTQAYSRVTLPLEIRTNTVYEMKLTLISSEGC